MNLQRLIILLAATLALLVAAPAAVAAQTYRDTVSGYEYAFTSTDGKFAGSASGSLPGAWNADVEHTPFNRHCPHDGARRRLRPSSRLHRGPECPHRSRYAQ